MIEIHRNRNQNGKGALAGLLLLVLGSTLGCTQERNAPVATPTPPFATPTSVALAPSALPTLKVDGIEVPDPSLSNPELLDAANSDSPVSQYARAFGLRPEDVARGLHAELETPVLSAPFVALRTADGVCLLLALRDEAGDWVWQKAMPGNYWAAYGKRVGVSMNGNEWRTLNNSALALEHFSNGGLLGLSGQVRPGADIVERRPSAAKGYLLAARRNHMGFVFSYVAEPGRFPRDVNSENVDVWLHRRLFEIAGVISDYKSGQPVYIQFNEASNEKGGWNRESNPLESRHGDEWVGEYLFQLMSIFMESGLVPNQDFFPMFNENRMLSATNQDFLHRIMSDGREAAFQRLVSQPESAASLSRAGIDAADDIKLILGSETHVNLDGRPSEGINWLEDPSEEQIVDLTKYFGDLGGVLFTEVAPHGSVAQQTEFLRKMMAVIMSHPELHGELLWNAFENPEDTAEGPFTKLSRSPTLLFDETGAPTPLFYEFLRESAAN